MNKTESDIMELAPSVEDLSLGQLKGPELPQAELAQDVRSLSRVSEWLGVAAIARQWLWVALLVTGFELTKTHIGSGWLPAYLVCVVAIASRQHCLLSLMHEA